eukprot:2602688-Amphidinium_carterae.1
MQSNTRWFVKRSCTLLGSSSACLSHEDIKIGQKTAAAGWMGKSMLASMRKSVVDGLTNSWTAQRSLPDIRTSLNDRLASAAPFLY